MFNINQTAANLMPSRNLTPVGAGYYALQHNTSAAGIEYTKLVKVDNSKPTYPGYIEPSVGSRNDRPSHRRARRNVQRAA